MKTPYITPALVSMAKDIIAGKTEFRHGDYNTFVTTMRSMAERFSLTRQPSKKAVWTTTPASMEFAHLVINTDESRKLSNHRKYKVKLDHDEWLAMRQKQAQRA